MDKNPIEDNRIAKTIRPSSTCISFSLGARRKTSTSKHSLKERILKIKSLAFPYALYTEANYFVRVYTPQTCTFSTAALLAF